VCEDKDKKRQLGDGVGCPTPAAIVSLLFTNGVRRERIEKPRDIVNMEYLRKARFAAFHRVDKIFENFYALLLSDRQFRINDLYFGNYEKMIN